MYGGQVIGQSMIAACHTVREEQHIHSLHCYFLRGGKSHYVITRYLPIMTFI